MRRFLISTLLCLMVALSGSCAFGQSYEQGLAKAESTESPLVIVVTASWCQPCKRLKAEIDSMRKHEMRDAIVVYVDAEERAELASQLMEGSTVPQLVMFHHSKSGWHRVRAVGLQTKDRILEMLRRVVR